MRFKQFFYENNAFKIQTDDDEDDWSEEDLLSYIHSKNASLKPPFAPPEYVDPDDFYNRGGIFTFIYHTGELEIARPGKTHQTMMRAERLLTYWKRRDRATGRYGIKDNCPCIAFWNSFNSVGKQALIAIHDNRLMHPETCLFIEGENQGLALNFIKPKMPLNKASALEQNVQVGNKQYYIFDLPRLLHSLPSNSAEFKQIASFICNNLEKYPIFKNFVNKAKCFPQSSNNSPPEYARRQGYWATSENYNR